MNTIELPILHRSATVDRKAVDSNNRTARLSFSSEAPVERWFGNEILDHGKDSVDLSRLTDGGPLLSDHNPDLQAGVVEEARIDKGRGVALVRFSKNPQGERELQDVADGIRTKVSVGYRVHKMILEKEEGDAKTYRVLRWEPLEISIVSIPADASVGVGRHHSDKQIRKFPVEIIDRVTSKGKTVRNLNSVLRRPDGDDGGGGESRADTGLERARTKDIMTLGRTHNCLELAGRAVENGDSVEDFKEEILRTKYRATAIDTPGNGNPLSLGMSRTEVKSWSLVRAIQCMMNKRPVDGLEGECSRAMAKVLRRDPSGVFIPFEIQNRSFADSQALSRNEVRNLLSEMMQVRALTAGTATAGGFTVQNSVLDQNLVELLRNQLSVVQLGAQSLSGLIGDVSLPRHTGGGTGYWLSETATVTDSQQTFGSLGLTPHRLVAATPYSKQLLAQSSLSIESFVRQDLLMVLAVAKDLAAISGNGSAGQPFGVMNVTGLGSLTFGGAATWAKVIDFETQIANANALRGRCAFLTTPSVRAKLKAIQRFTSTDSPLWMPDGTVNGYPGMVSLQVPSNKVIFGNWNELILADWEGWDVVTDPYGLATSGQVRVTIQIMTDNGVRHAGSFCVSTDSGAQ